MTTAETAEGGEDARGNLRARWRVALAAVSVTAAVAMTGWALGTPPGGALPSGVEPAGTPSQPREATWPGTDGARIVVPMEGPDRAEAPGES